VLLRTLFILAFLGLVAETILHGAGALANAQLHHRALAAARADFGRGVESTRQAIAVAMQSGGAIALPSPASTCVVRGTTNCELTAETSVQTMSPNPNDASACPATACTVYMQRNDAIGEDRIAVNISTTVSAPGGAPLAQRSSLAVFRTFRVPPYAILTGSTDTTLDSLANGSAGDDGGSNSDAGNTLVNVVYRNGSGPPIPANVWAPQMQHPQSSTPFWDH
jgi:hypothetical protein